MKEMPCCLGSGPSVTGTVTGMGTGRAAARRKKRGESETKPEILMMLIKVYCKA